MSQVWFSRLILAAALALFVALPPWRWAIGERPGPMRYEVSAQEFAARLDAQAKAYGSDSAETVAPPPGDVYVLAERWRFRPLLELQAGQTYRLHVASGDILHGFHLAGNDALLVPGSAITVIVTPEDSGTLVMQCSEFCGTDHNRMRAAITITP